MAAQSTTVEFVAERETKNTVRFAEAGDPEDHSIGTLYVQKAALDGIGNPEKIKVTVTAG